MNNSQTWMEVNLDNLNSNLNAIRNKVGSTKVAAVVKANAYGLGVVEVSKFLEKKGIDYFCVANFNEAMELRENGIKKPILVMGYVPENLYEESIENGLELTLFDCSKARKLNEIASELNLVAKIHIKIDTGMSRLGYVYSEKNEKDIIDEIKRIYFMSNINIKGIYSHFSSADEFDKSFTKMQYEKFTTLLMSLNREDIDIEISHISNDAGTLYYGYFLDMIRTGICLYGYYPSKVIKSLEPIKLKQVATIISTVTNVKFIDEKTAVSYNREFVSSKKMKLATICMGYADGYPMSLSNKGYVMINGKKANIVGKICMDQFMADISHIDNVKIGDKVLIFGERGMDFLDLEELAYKGDKIVYDIICGTNMRVPRFYIEDGKVIKQINYIRNK